MIGAPHVHRPLRGTAAGAAGVGNRYEM